MAIIVFILGLTAMAGILLLALRRRKKTGAGVPAGLPALLQEHVGFYRALNDPQKSRFEKRVATLLGQIRIHGVRTGLEDIDRILVGASGVIPVFGLGEWTYNNLSDVLLYEEAFDSQRFGKEEDNRHDVLGMVGNGAMERVMILSKPALREGFANTSGTANTGIHEFVHLVDKADGAVDGIPEILLGHQAGEWVTTMDQQLILIRNGHSDINSYAGKNQAEFFAVLSEYFFKRPDLLKIHHPDVYALLVHIFQQEPATDPYLNV